MPKKGFYVAVAALAGVALAWDAAAAVTVDCGIGESISTALANGETYITVNGTCVERVDVYADDVTIVGGDGGVINGALTVNGAQRFTMQNIAVTATAGDDIEGIWVTDNASAKFWNVTVSGEQEYCAVLVYNDSFAYIRHGTLDNNAYGLCVGVGSLASSRDTAILNSENLAVEVYQHGTYRSRDDTFGESADDGPTISLSRNSFADLRSGNVTGDVTAVHQSHLFVRQDSTVDGNISADILSELDLQDSHVTGNVEATNLSIATMANGASIDGRVSCVGMSMCLPRSPR